MSLWRSVLMTSRGQFVLVMSRGRGGYSVCKRFISGIFFFLHQHYNRWISITTVILWAGAEFIFQMGDVIEASKLINGNNWYFQHWPSGLLASSQSFRPVAIQCTWLQHQYLQHLTSSYFRFSHGQNILFVRKRGTYFLFYILKCVLCDQVTSKNVFVTVPH